MIHAATVELCLYCLGWSARQTVMKWVTGDIPAKRSMHESRLCPQAVSDWNSLSTNSLVRQQTLFGHLLVELHAVLMLHAGTRLHGASDTWPFHCTLLLGDPSQPSDTALIMRSATAVEPKEPHILDMCVFTMCSHDQSAESSALWFHCRLVGRQRHPLGGFCCCCRSLKLCRCALFTVVF